LTLVRKPTSLPTQHIKNALQKCGSASESSKLLPVEWE
jgi:hypothetical protein